MSHNAMLVEAGRTKFDRILSKQEQFSNLSVEEADNDNLLSK